MSKTVNVSFNLNVGIQISPSIKKQKSKSPPKIVELSSSGTSEREKIDRTLVDESPSYSTTNQQRSTTIDTVSGPISDGGETTEETSDDKRWVDGISFGKKCKPRFLASDGGQSTTSVDKTNSYGNDSSIIVSKISSGSTLTAMVEGSKGGSSSSNAITNQTSSDSTRSIGMASPKYMEDLGDIDPTLYNVPDLEDEGAASTTKSTSSTSDKSSPPSTMPRNKSMRAEMPKKKPKSPPGTVRA